jgi:hypothetical protein
MRQRGTASARPCLGTWIWILRFGDRFGTLPDVPPRHSRTPWRWKPRFVRFRGFCQPRWKNSIFELLSLGDEGSAAKRARSPVMAGGLINPPQVVIKAVVVAPLAITSLSMKSGRSPGINRPGFFFL